MTSYTTYMLSSVDIKIMSPFHAYITIEKNVLPPISTTMYFEPAVTTRTLSSSVGMTKGIVWHQIEAASDSKAIPILALEMPA